MELVNTISRSQSLAMADDYLLRQAVERAWILYRAAHNDVQSRMNAGAEELMCARLAYLERLLSEAK